MKTAVFLLMGVMLSNTARAETSRCYYLWEAQCFEIHDARTRDITQHLLITDGPASLEAEGESCDARLTRALDDRAGGDLLAAFNKRIGRIDGCNTLDSLEPRIFRQPGPALEHLRRRTRPHDRKEVYKVAAPEL